MGGFVTLLKCLIAHRAGDRIKYRLGVTKNLVNWSLTVWSSIMMGYKLLWRSGRGRVNRIILLAHDSCPPKRTWVMSLISLHIYSQADKQTPKPVYFRGPALSDAAWVGWNHQGAEDSLHILRTSSWCQNSRSPDLLLNTMAAAYIVLWLGLHSTLIYVCLSDIQTCYSTDSACNKLGRFPFHLEFVTFPSWCILSYNCLGKRLAVGR